MKSTKTFLSAAPPPGSCVCVCKQLQLPSVWPSVALGGGRLQSQIHDGVASPHFLSLPVYVYFPPPPPPSHSSLLQKIVQLHPQQRRCSRGERSDPTVCACILLYICLQSTPQTQHRQYLLTLTRFFTRAHCIIADMFRMHYLCDGQFCVVMLYKYT